MFGCKIKSIQMDGGGEYNSTQFKNILFSYGISHYISCPHTPEQNGLAGRKYRHIVETGLTLMAHSHMPQKFWVDAFITAVFLINCLPAHTLGNICPYEKLFKTSPNYSLLRSFGCSCFHISIHTPRVNSFTAQHHVYFLDIA